MRKLLPFAILSFLSVSATAQRARQDYVITTLGDTLRGRLQVAGKKSSGVLLYRPGVARSQFGPAEASSYGTTGGPIKVSKRIGSAGKSQFLVPLVEGYASLYSGENEQHEKRYYLQAPGAEYVTEVERATSQLTLARTLAGCPALDFGTDELQRRYPYTANGMTELVLAYNSCRQPNQPSRAVKRASNWRVTVGAKAGINVSDFDIAAPAYAGFGTQHEAPGYQAGLTLNIASLNHFSAQIEANYIVLRAKYGPYEAYVANVGLPSNTHTTRLKYTQLQVPVLLRYEFGYGAIRPFVNAGPSVGVNMGNSSADTYASSTAASVITEPVEVGKTALGLAVGGGIAIHQASLPVLSLELRYDRVGESTPHAEYYLHLLRHNSVRVEAGIAF